MPSTCNSLTINIKARAYKQRSQSLALLYVLALLCDPFSSSMDWNPEDDDGRYQKQTAIRPWKLTKATFDSVAMKD